MMSVDMIDLSCTGARRAIMLEIQYTWDPAMISVDMIDLSCTVAHYAILLEIQYTWDPAMISVDMIDLSYAGDVPGTLP